MNKIKIRIAATSIDPARTATTDHGILCSAAWNYVVISQWILGIRPAFDGLEIAPVLPSSWDNLEVTRIFRGVRYTIQIKRLGPGNEVRLEVGGESVEGTIVGLPPEGTKEIQVTAIIRKLTWTN
jgi:cellobiose phosphorylase